MRVGSLFAGIGGFDLAARNIGWTTVWVSEIDPYASAVLAKHFPVPNYGDITKIDFTQVEPVDVLCGGFPCQDISTAGKGEGIDGERSGLWKEYKRAIGELRPRYVVVENVAALLGRGLERVLGDLAALGYDAEWHCIPASSVGAPHKRDRIWIVAYPQSVGHGGRGGERHLFGADGGPDRPMRPKPRRAGAEPEYASSLADSISQRGCGGEDHRQDATDVDAPGEGIRPGRDGGWWAVEPDVGRVANGVPFRVDRLRGLGNAIVPQVAEVLFRAIQEREA